MIFQKLFSDETQNASLSVPEKYPMYYSNSISYFQQLLAPFQFIAWLIFHPSAWRGYIQRIDSTLAADFALADLSTPTPELRRLLRFTFLLQPLLVGVLIGLVLLFIKFFLWFVDGIPAMLEVWGIDSLPILELHSLIPVENLILGISYGIVLSFVGSTIASFTISMAFGIVVGVLGGLSAGILFGLVGTKTVAGLWLGLFVVSLAGSVTASLQHAHHQNRTWKWQIGGVIIGLTVSAIVLLIGFMLGSGFGHLVAQLAFIKLTLPQAQIIGMAAAVGLILGWRKDARWMATLALFFASMIWLLISLIFNVLQAEQTLWLRRLLSGIAGGAVNGILLTLLFSMPYMMTRYIAGAWAGVVAGILGSGGTYLGFALFIAQSGHEWLWLAGGLVSMGLGLTYQWWLPVVLYPITAAWNLSLLLSQKRQPERSGTLLLRHSAFWDEHQYLRLWGLEKQLVAGYQQEESAAKKAMNHLLAGHQSWAVQAAQMELDWQRLEQCQEMTEIAKVHQALLSRDPLTGTAGQWLGYFRQMSVDVDAALSQHSQNQQHAMLTAVISFLDGLLIGGERATEVQRFITIAASWKGLMDEYAEKLFQKQDIPNPYSYGLPLDRKHHPVFAERFDVLQSIEQLLQQHRCPPLLLYGQRRIGKTTLLMNMNTMLPSNFVMLLVDFQGPIVSSQDHAGFFHNLGRALLQSAEEHYPDLKLPPLDKQTLIDDPFAGFDEWLYQLEKAAADKIFLLALDEFVTIDSSFEKKRFEPKAILGMFRHIIQHRPRFRLLFAGTHTFAELEQWATYFINAKTVHMSYLSDEEARRLVEEPIKYFPLRYTPEASQRVLTVTRQHPALIQLLCGEIVLLKDQQTPDKRLQVKVDEVEMAIASALKHGSMFFADIEQNQVGEIGQMVLRFIASQGEGAVVNRQDLEAQFPSDLKATLELLELREVIEEQDSGYRFQIEMVRRWFTK